MTQTMGSSVSGSGASSGSAGASTRDVAKDEARGVAQDAAEGARSTAATAKDQAGQVAGEAASQVKQLTEQARQELTNQGSAQKERATGGLRSLADELSGLVSGEAPSSGMVRDLAQEAADRVRSTADWLETHEPSDVLREVRGFASRRPGVFLLSAAAAGFLGGRLTRGLADEVKEYAEAEQRQTGAGYSTGYAAPATTGAALGEELPQDAPGTPGYSIPPASDPTTEFSGDLGTSGTTGTTGEGTLR